MINLAGNYFTANQTQNNVGNYSANQTLNMGFNLGGGTQILGGVPQPQGAFLQAYPQTQFANFQQPQPFAMPMNGYDQNSTWGQAFAPIYTPVSAPLTPPIMMPAPTVFSQPQVPFLTPGMSFGFPFSMPVHMPYVMTLPGALLPQPQGLSGIATFLLALVAKELKKLGNTEKPKTESPAPAPAPPGGDTPVGGNPPNTPLPPDAEGPNDAPGNTGGTDNNGGTGNTGGTDNNGGTGNTGGTDNNGGTGNTGGTDNNGGTGNTGGTNNNGGGGNTTPVTPPAPPPATASDLSLTTAVMQRFVYNADFNQDGKTTLEEAQYAVTQLGRENQEHPNVETEAEMLAGQRLVANFSLFDKAHDIKYFNDHKAPGDQPIQQTVDRNRGGVDSAKVNIIAALDGQQANVSDTDFTNARAALQAMAVPGQAFSGGIQANISQVDLEEFFLLASPDGLAIPKDEAEHTLNLLKQAPNPDDTVRRQIAAGQLIVDQWDVFSNANGVSNLVNGSDATDAAPGQVTVAKLQLISSLDDDHTKVSAGDFDTLGLYKNLKNTVPANFTLDTESALNVLRQAGAHRGPQNDADLVVTDQDLIAFLNRTNPNTAEADIARVLLANKEIFARQIVTSLASPIPGSALSTPPDTRSWSFMISRIRDVADNAGVAANITQADVAASTPLNPQFIGPA